MADTPTAIPDQAQRSQAPQMTGRLEAFFNRHSGKKFFITMAGLFAIAMLFEVYLVLVGPGVPTFELTLALLGAFVGVGMVCIGGGISVGLSEMNRGKKDG